MEANEVERETVKDETYRGVDYTIVRTNEPEFAEGSGFEYEFVAYIDGEETMTAGQLEAAGWENPWIPALSRHVEARIDGRLD